jgi:SSS family transporter
VIGGYLLLLMLVGVAFKRFTRDANDFVRSGCRATWWLVGASSFMTAFSAWTFTGGAGAAFEAGWSFIVIFFSNAVGFLLLAMFLAPWFRQTRAISVPELIRRRFDVGTQQFVAYLGSITGVIISAIWLFGLATFASTIFGLRVDHVIIGLGSVVVFYSFLSGSWGVMATDFVQSIILFPVTVLMAILALHQIGGVGEIFRQINEQGLSDHFKLFNTGEFDSRVIDFSMLWAFAMIIRKCYEYLGMGSARRFFAVKDGREARKGALLAFFLMLGGTFLWVIPPIVARLLYADEIMAMGISKPSEAAYAVISLKLLPAGMTGLMVVAMFSATMSSMDTGLNTNAAIFINDIYPALCRLAHRRPLEGRPLRFLAQAWTLLLGTVIILVAVNFSRIKGVGVFRLMQEMGAVFGSVFGVPMLLGLLIRRTPSWSAMAAILIAAIPSALGLMSGRDFFADVPFLATPWKVHTRIFLNSAVGTAVFLGSMIFYRSSKPGYKEKVGEFFRCMKTPVNFEKEVGGAVDVSQLRIVGSFTFIIGLLLCGLLAVPNTWGLGGRTGILFVTSTVMIIGALLFAAGLRSEREMNRASRAGKQNDEDSGDVAT